MYNYFAMINVIYEDKKIKKKTEKIERDSNNAKTELAKAKEVLDDTMKQSWEDLELWKQKEIAKGKDLQKVEKKYQRGVKVLERLEGRFDRMHDRNLTRVEDWDYNGRAKIEKAAYKRLILKVSTSSLAKMEKILEKDPQTDLRYVIAAYTSIVKKHKVNPIKHPLIMEEINKWENSIKKASGEDEYFKIFLSLIEEDNKKDKKLAFKKEVARRVNDILQNDNISIRFVSEYTGIKYSNLYNFLKNEIYTELSFRRAHLLLWTIINLEKGWTKEEALRKHISKMEKIKDFWDDELLKE